MKRILSLDIGITSIGYSILDEIENEKYGLIDYGVSMFDKPTDKDGKSKKLIHSSLKSASNLAKLRKKRKQNLALLFEKYNLGNKDSFLQQEKQNLYPNKWYLRAVKAFNEKLTINELFSIFYLIAKHRGYKSLDSDDLLEELAEKLGLNLLSKEKKDTEKGKIKEALKSVENLRLKNPNKTVASIIYENEIVKANPTFRNHDNYNYMIRREHINEEVSKIIYAQKEFALFDENFDIESFIKDLISTIDDQKDSSIDLSLFAQCTYYPDKKVAHQYSLLSDIYKMYESVANIKLDGRKITKEEIKIVIDDFFKRLEKGKNIADIKYQDIRKVLKLDENIKLFGKEDFYIDKKGKKVHYKITKFHFISNLSKFDKNFIVNILNREEKFKIMQDIFDVLQFEKAPNAIYYKLNDIFKNYNLLENQKSIDETILNLIKYKSGKTLNISAFAMREFIPYFEEGYTLDDIKQKLNLGQSEDYSKYKKGIKYLHISSFEKDDGLEINNHPVKYVVSAVIRLIKHLHSKFGAFDEIKVESTRELSLNKEAQQAIEKANRENEKKFNEIIENEEYQKIANHYRVNLKKYAKKLMLWEEQEKLDIYSGKTIGFEEIFTNEVDIDHIVPKSIGGLNVKHNLVLAHRDENVKKSNRLPMDFVKDKEAFINRVEMLFQEHRINWKKRKNLLANNLDEIYKDTFESKSLRATSYIEALTAKIIKRYYPFPNKDKQSNGQGVVHIQGRATSNIRKLLNVKSKSRDTNIHHAVDAILIGLTNKSWLQKISNAFRENLGVIDEEAQKRIKKAIPVIEGIEPKELIELIEENYLIYGEDSIFYKDIYGNKRIINFWVSKKSDSSKIHKDTIYAKKADGYFTARENLLEKFKKLKITIKTKPEDFAKKYKKEILEKMYVYQINPKDKICEAVNKRAKEIEELLKTFVDKNFNNKDEEAEAKERLNNLINKEIIDNNGKIVRRVQFYQKNLSGIDVRGGLAVAEKTFIGFEAKYNGKKIEYKRIDMSNYQKLKKENRASFKVFKNDIVFFVYKEGSFKGGRIVSFLEGKNMASFSNPKYPSNIKQQPHSFVTMFQGKPNSHKQHSVGKAIGLIKINLDILGNIKSFQRLGAVPKEVEDRIFHKE